MARCGRDDAPHRPAAKARVRRAYTAQAVNLVGDGLTWVGLALLAHELAGRQAAALLAVALIARVATYVVVAPWAGVLADRAPRRRLLVASCLGRLVLVLALAVVTTGWVLVVVVLALNALAAVYTPTFNASLPTLVGEEEYGDALALSSATFEVLGVVGPAAAAAIVLVAPMRRSSSLTPPRSSSPQPCSPASISSAEALPLRPGSAMT